MDVVVPNLGESIVDASIAKVCKKVGDAVGVDEVLFELETDKATIEINALSAGVIKELKVSEGDEVKVGAVVAVLQEVKSGQSDVKSTTKEVEEIKEQDTVNNISSQTQLTERLHNKQNSPAANLAMQNMGIEASDVVGTGKDGRITKLDVANYVPSQVVTTKTQIKHDSLNAAEQRQRIVPMTKLRQKIAQRLKESQNTAAMLTTFNEVDMQNVMKIRAKYKELFEKKHGIKLGFMSFFVKAVIAALKEFPEINAEIKGTDIVYKDFYNIGVAVGSPNGLVVPVIKDAQNFCVADIEKAIASFGKKAKEGKLNPQEMQNGTFTISNGGIYGSLMSTPIINPPQSGILGMHAIKERPVVIDGKIEVRPMMYLALSYDHRIVDGKEAVTFLVRIKSYIESPERLILDV